MTDPNVRLMTGLNVRFDAEELPDLLRLLNRALYTWDTKLVPKWAWELEAKVVAKINDNKRHEHSSESPSQG